MTIVTRGLIPANNLPFGVALTPAGVFPYLLAMAKASGITPEKLAESYIAEKDLRKFAKLFLAEVIRLSAEEEAKEKEVK